MIEIADDAHAAAAGRPDSEIDAANAFESLNVCAELIVGVVVAAFTHQVKIEFAEEEWERVSIELLQGCAGGEAILNAVGGGCGAILLSFGERGFKEAVGPELCCFDDTRRIKETNGRGNRAGMECANHPAAACGRVDLMRAEQGERIGVAADDECVNGLIELRSWRGRPGGGRLFRGVFWARGGCPGQRGALGGLENGVGAPALRAL